MTNMRILAVAALASAITVTAASAQQTQRLRGTIEKVDGNRLIIKMPNGTPATVMLTDKAAVVGVLKASLADVKQGSYIGSAAMPQPDGPRRPSRSTSSPSRCAGRATAIATASTGRPARRRHHDQRQLRPRSPASTAR